MAKLYSKKKVGAVMAPKKETIRFLLDYSKAFRLVKAGKMQFECIAN